MGMMWSFELGALYIDRKEDFTAQSTSGLTQDQHAIQVPALLRLRLGRFFPLGQGDTMPVRLDN